MDEKSAIHSIRTFPGMRKISPHLFSCPKCGEPFGVITGRGEDACIMIGNVLIHNMDATCGNCGNEMHMEMGKKK